MKSRLHRLNLSLLLLVGQPASAQLLPAEDFFNGGAQLYISNNIPAALERVEMGLKTYPQDEKLKKLETLLKQQQQQQQQQQQKDQQQQAKDDQQKNQAQQQKEQQKSEDQKQKEAAQKKNESPKDPESQKAEAEKQKADEQKAPESQAQPAKPGEMTPEEAKRLLDAQKGNEQLLQWKPENKPRDRRRPLKDW